MLLHNNSNKIIGITVNTSILPGETGECPKGYEDNPVIKKYITNGTFTVVGGAEDSNSDPSTGKAPEEMTEEELTQYAQENGIDIGKATSKEGMLKKIQDAQKAG